MYIHNEKKKPLKNNHLSIRIRLGEVPKEQILAHIDPLPAIGFCIITEPHTGAQKLHANRI